MLFDPGSRTVPCARRADFRWINSANQMDDFSHWSRAARAGLLPEDVEARRTLLELFLFQKAFYEIGYEAANRPTWLSIPVRGLLDLVRRRTAAA